jgi:C-terminal peptidase prc
MVTVLIVVGSPHPAAAQGPLANCTTTSQNLYVRDVLFNYYYWYTELPGVNPTRYASPEAYLDAVRFRPLDEHFSYITSRAANDAFFGESQYVGFGVAWALRGGELRVQEVFPDSPASEAGMARGDRVTAVAGEAVSQLVATSRLDAALGTSDVGVTVPLQFVSRAGAAQSATLVKRVVTIPTVSRTRVYEASGKRIGYIFFRNFVSPSPAALDQAFAELTGARVDDLVLDLRYNGGGLVRVAQHLASLIGGAVTRGQVFAEYFHNDKNAFRNQVLRFEEKPNAATLNRLIVITTPASASASELVINALRPFMPVIVIGDRTYGKPVGQYSFDFCDKTLAPVSFSLRNANGEGDFFNGFAPDCPAADDVEHDLGDANEASLSEALTFAATGACSRRLTPQTMLRADRRAPRLLGWQSIVNAY